jgi:cyclopropane-fatty-acyl-phospholipid synthase
MAATTSRPASTGCRTPIPIAAEILDLFRATYGADQAAIWLQRWRMFYLACAELFGYAGGEQWLVGHYRFVRR